VRDEDDLPEPQLGNDGVEVTNLIVGGVTPPTSLMNSRRFIRITSPQARKS
jgi:hypothetical protein